MKYVYDKRFAHPPYLSFRKTIYLGGKSENSCFQAEMVMGGVGNQSNERYSVPNLGTNDTALHPVVPAAYLPTLHMPPFLPE